MISSTNYSQQLLEAVSKGHLVGITAALDAKADIHCENRFQMTPLMLAAKHGYLAAVELLIAKQANIHGKPNQHDAFSLALVDKHYDIMQLLINANVDIKGGREEIEESFHHFYATPLQMAMMMNDGITMKMLMRHGAYVRGEGYSQLFGYLFRGYNSYETVDALYSASPTVFHEWFKPGQLEYQFEESAKYDNSTSCLLTLLKVCEKVKYILTPEQKDKVEAMKKTIQKRFVLCASKESFIAKIDNIFNEQWLVNSLFFFWDERHKDAKFADDMGLLS